MSTISNLPVEIILMIVKECLLPENNHKPIIGSSAAWEPLPRFLSGEPIRPNQTGLFGKVTREEAWAYPCALKALRLTNKAFKILVEPYLFKEVNILYSLRTERAKNVQEYIIEPHWRHVHVIRAYVDDDGTQPESEEHEPDEDELEKDVLVTREYDEVPHVERIANLIAKCQNIQTLGLYYNTWLSDFGPITHTVTSLLEQGRLDTVGVYAHAVIDDYWSLWMVSSSVLGPMVLLQAIASSPHGLKKLDIATEWLPRETYELLQVRTIPHLSSLTIRYAFRHQLLWEEDPIKRLSWWTPSTNLVRLQLINCQTTHSADIPVIVGQFPALEELLVSTCGYRGDLIPPRRSSGWSREPDALWRRKTPLKVFVIEHMDSWEVRELGVIPTTMVVSANVRQDMTLKALEEDGELFPGLRILRVLPYQRTESDQPDPMQSQEQAERAAAISKRFEAICSERKLELHCDAVRYRPCSCC